MIKGIGTDIASVERIEGLLASQGERLPQRVLTEAEWARFQQVKQPAAWLAKRFAAKEAASKALGTGIAEGISWRHIEVDNDEAGAPRLRLYEAALARADALGVTSCHLSLSDERAFAVAFVVLEG